MKIEIKKCAQNSSAKNQFIAAIVVNALSVSYGVSAGWSGPNISILMSDETPLPSGKITMSQASWIASLTSVGGTIGTLIFGYITNKFGRKMPLIFLTIPIIVSWTLILVAQNIYFLYAARLINGFAGGGIYIILPLYVSEIANDRVRGVLGSITVLSSCLGVLLVFITSGFCDYFTTPKYSIVLAALYGILFTTFPETPITLIKQNKITEAENAIKFYQNLHDDKNCNETVQLEMNKLKNTIYESNKCDGKSLSWSDCVKNPGKKGLTIGLGVAILSQFCGIPGLVAYTTLIFEAAESNISPNTATIVVGVIQLFGSCITTNLVDRAGRKFLYTTSAIGTSLSFSILGTYMLFKSMGYAVEAYSWIPIVSFSSILFVGNSMLALPFIIISEVLNEKIKDFGATMCITIIWFCAFLVVKFLPLLNETLDFHGTMFLFAGICLSSAIIIILFLPETKGKSYDEIMEMLR